jgi:DNA-directed RNA polymerase subunit alpha
MHKVECVETGENYGRFVAGPLEKGMGITLGNALRRALLGYLTGAAVTRVRIEGIQHEFSTIPHVKEDTTEFLLNVKALRLKPVSGEAGRLELEVTGEGQVCAADINPSADFEIVNPELYLITLDSPEARLFIEFDVELGIGYRAAESSDNLPVGVIPIDAIFSPVRKVNYTIEPLHVGQETGHEQLILDIWTDGTTTPMEALSQSAKTLVEQLSPFADYVRASQLEEKRLAATPVLDEKYNIPVEQLDLSVRTMNCLRRAGITTIGELMSLGEKELMSLRNFGLKSKQEIEERLNSLGLSLAPSPEESEADEDEIPELEEADED